MNILIAFSAGFLSGTIAGEWCAHLGQPNLTVNIVAGIVAFTVAATTRTALERNRDDR